MCGAKHTIRWCFNFRYQKRCDELSSKNAHYSEQYEQMSTNQKEIVDFLNKSLEQKGITAQVFPNDAVYFNLCTSMS